MREELLTAFQEGNFLQVVSNKYLGSREDSSVLVDELVDMHNQRLIDIIAGFQALEKKPDAGYDFFLTRRIFEDALPRLDAPIRPVMQCVIHLVNEAGQDMAAGTPFDAFIEFCSAEPCRPKESLNQIEAALDQLADLLVPTIVAGARIDTEHYLNEAIRLAEHENIEIRKRAIFSLGRMQYAQDSNLYDPAFVCLDRALRGETDDQLLGNIIKSAFSLYKQGKAKLERTMDLIQRALSPGGDYVLHAASELFFIYFNELPESLLETLLDHLRGVSPQNRGTIRNIDYGLAKLLAREDPSKGIEFVESLLTANPQELSLDSLDSVLGMLSKNKNMLNRLLTRWFLRGDRVLCDGVCTMVNRSFGRNMQLSVDPSEVNLADPKQILFVARKTIGYLFTLPVTAASIIVSLIQHTTGGETADRLGSLLFDPLLINYPGKVSEYLVQQKETEIESVRSSAEEALKAFDDYLNGLKSTGEIPELYPSQLQRDAHQRHFSRIISESMKEAEKESVFLSLVSKSVLLYGRKSVNYAYDSNGQSNRMEIPLKSHSIEMEYPRREVIDPFGLEYMLRVFRAEQIVYETDN